MSTAASSSARNWRGKKPLGASMSLLASSPPHALAPLSSLLPPGTLSFVPCHCCRFRITIHLVSKTDAYSGQVFYKCLSHRVRFIFALFCSSGMHPPPSVSCLFGFCNWLNAIIANITTGKMDHATWISWSENGTLPLHLALLIWLVSLLVMQHRRKKIMDQKIKAVLIVSWWQMYSRK